MVVSSTINGELTQQDRELNMIEPQNLVGSFSIPGMTMRAIFEVSFDGTLEAEILGNPNNDHSFGFL